MAGSISAGAYTAGVIDYLLEALENWEKAKKTDTSVPDHQVVIDLLCGSSGGGMTGAMAIFALMDKIGHGKLSEDGLSYEIPHNNILWNSWVELSKGDILGQLLETSDITNYDVSAALNTSFIDSIAKELKQYIVGLSEKEYTPPPYMGIAPEMFMTLFNVTGINYELHSKAATTSSSGKQYVSDHRDMAHFRWSDEPYEGDGRMHISLTNKEHYDVIIDSAKATGAFPVGLKARKVTRLAKYIRDNPFFNRNGKIDKKFIYLGEAAKNDDLPYTSLNADGGTANNEPVELARDLLLNMRYKKYKDAPVDKPVEEMNDTEKTEAKSEYLVNSSLLLIDPFPSTHNDIKVPGDNASVLTRYIPPLISALNSQLIFDAKDAMDAYKKENYGLHIISPSKDGVDASIAIACASMHGFGGFLSREFRVHDFFLGRHNCESFLRKYFVANLDEPDPENRKCIEVILDSYLKNDAAIKRFAFVDENNKRWVPIIPDVSLSKPLETVIVQENPKKVVYKAEHELPMYSLKPFGKNFLKPYKKSIARRYMKLISNLYKTGRVFSILISIVAYFTRKPVTNKIIAYINKDLRERKLIE
jgi:hypothetical protein